MPTRAMKVRSRVLLGLLIVPCVMAAAHTAAAFGLNGFAARGAFRPSAAIGRPMPPSPAVPRGGIGGPGIYGGFPGHGYGGSPRYHAPIGGLSSGAVHSGTNGGSNSGRHNGTARNNRGDRTAAGGEQSFVPNEVITAFAPGATPQTIARIAQRYSLTQVESESFPLIGETLYRWRIGGRRSTANVVRALGRESIVSNVQPDYLFALQEPNTVAATRGDAAQYVLSMLNVEQAQQLATGKDVPIAIIDSGVDLNHPDLKAAAVTNFDALGGAGKSLNPHGTSIAGAIVARGKLLGIAPGAALLAIRAFDDAAGAARGASFTIYKGLQWAVDHGARVVNMSFAGPADPILQRMLAAASDKGIVLIAAGGNGGSQAQPQYPAAYSNVIAVTAVDSKDQLYKMANRSRYIAVSAPGVDVLALAPDARYQLATGTSIAAAHVSAIAALLLERKPSLKPNDVRAILVATAVPLGSPRPDPDFGAGLVNAYRALTLLDRKPSEPAQDAATQAKQ